MKISLEWISDFVDLSGIDPDEIADRLTLSTAEVEGTETICRAVDGVFIGELVKTEPLDATTETGNRLVAATIDCGRQGRFETVCGAPNARLGLKSLFAPAGTKLTGEKPIHTGVIAGRKSEGILCSARELGFSNWHEIILEVPGSVAAGTQLSEFVSPRDVLIEIDNKSLTHRPDLWGQYGFARELAAIFERPLKPLERCDLSRFEDLPEYPIEVDDLECCPCYSCIEFEAPGAVPSPLWMQARLHVLEQRSHKLLVDLTNYVLLELAQPTHAFDAERIKAIRVARLGQSSGFSTLDDQERSMRPDDLMIFNESRPVALAGIMGGLNSQVENNTRRVLLESANFKASRVRVTSVRLGLRTESSQRFEKSLPPVIVKWGTARILHLMEQAGVPIRATSRWSVQGDVEEDSRQIELPAGFVQAKGGVTIRPNRVATILTSLGFETKTLDDGRMQVDVPAYRSRRDLSIPIDIVEEVLRIYGYDNIEPSLPASLLQPAQVNRPMRLEHKARRLLTAGHRFLEVQGYAWFDDRWLDTLGLDPGPTLTLKNPSIEHKRRLRTTLLPNLLALVPKNRVHRDRFRLCEFGRVFQPIEDNGCEETTRLAGVSYKAETGSPEDHFREIKGVLEDLARSLGCGQLAFVESDGESLSGKGDSRNPAPWQSAGHWLDVRLGEASVGTFGLLAGSIRETVAEIGQVVWFELMFDQLEGPVHPAIEHVGAPIYPGSWQDFSLVWDMGQGFSTLEEILERFTHPLVRRRSFLAVYKGKGLPQGKGSYTFRFWLGLDERTLTGEDIDGFRDAWIGFLDREGISLR